MSYLIDFIFISTIFLAISGFRIIRQNEIGVVESFGKFTKILNPGLNWIIPLVQKIYHLDTRIVELQSIVEVKTQDNMFVSLPVKIQLFPAKDKIYNAYYKLENPSEQIKSWILNSIRSITSKMDLQEIYSDKNQIVSVIQGTLTQKLNDFGYTIEDILVDQPTLPETIQHSFNRVLAAQREAEAAKQEGEALRIKIEAQANADANSQKIRAEGMAIARSILARGLDDSIKILKDNNLDANHLILTLVELNRLDVLKDIGSHGNLIIANTNEDKINALLATLKTKNT